MSNEITEIINTLCEKLGVAADILVPEMARYYIARLVFLTLIKAIIAIIVAIVFIKIIKWILNEMDTPWNDWDDKLFVMFFAGLIPGIVLLALSISAISNAADLIGWIASPTASAVREIASLMK